MAREIVVWIIEADQWPRAYLIAELAERGLGAIGYPHLSEAVADLGAGLTPRPGAIVMELRDQYVEPSLIDALMGSGVPVVLLTGAIERDERIKEGYGWAAVMKRPFTVGSVADKVQEIADGDSSV
jgi:hypothetical protein